MNFRKECDDGLSSRGLECGNEEFSLLGAFPGWPQGDTSPQIPFLDRSNPTPGVTAPCSYTLQPDHRSFKIFSHGLGVSSEFQPLHRSDLPWTQLQLLVQLSSIFMQ